jgi:predicted branched-subunit amino acid permease
MIAPIGVAAAAFALSFGVLARSAGMGWVAPLVMSATTFAGSAQFAVVSVLGGAGSAVAAVAAAVMLNARYAPIGISIASAFRGPVPTRLVQSQLIVDESWAMTLRRKGGFDVHVLLGAGALLYLCWNA